METMKIAAITKEVSRLMSIFIPCRGFREIKDGDGDIVKPVFQVEVSEGEEVG